MLTQIKIGMIVTGLDLSMHIIDYKLIIYKNHKQSIVNTPGSSVRREKQKISAKWRNSTTDQILVLKAL